MKKLVFSMLLFAFSAVHAQHYVFHVDLTACSNNRLPVVLDVPELNRDTLLYQFPTTIPGSYMVKNYAAYISAIKAYNREGKKLKVKYNAKENNFRIFKARELARIEYKVEGTWTSTNAKDYIFQPGGTQFELNTFYLLNTHALFGFFQGYEKMPYELNITKQPELYGATSAPLRTISGNNDKVELPNYATLIDNPIMYSRPDTASIQVKNCNFRIAVYSRTGAVTAAQVLDIMKPVLTKAMAHFFPQFQSDNYCFSFFFSGPDDEDITRNGGTGALEHSQSSFYFSYETRDSKQLKIFVTHVTAHEFLHTLTPLSLKSERVFNYNFKMPVMSKHLWMYEGAVEYLSGLSCMQDSILTEKEFLENLHDKIMYSNHYPNISMTEFGEKICEKEYKDTYVNIYNRGALINFMLDIRINELSGGNQNLQKVLLAMDKKYKGSYFSEDDLIPELIANTHPKLKGIIDSLVITGRSLPVSEYLGKIGYNYYLEKRDSAYSYGDWAVRFDISRKQCIILHTEPQYNLYGITSGDHLISVDGVTVDDTNFSNYMDLLENPSEDRPLELVFEHYGRRYRDTKRPIHIAVRNRCVIEPNPHAGPEQLQLRKQVLGR